MDLYTLSAEYHDTAARLRERIIRLRAALPEAAGEEAALLEHRIAVLSSELRDLRQITSYLRNYYVS